MKQGTKHVLVTGALLLVLVVLPCALFLNTGVLTSMLFGQGYDLVSSATAIAAPSGTYSIFINRELHTNVENLELWRSFFAGEDVPLIWEDISCVCVDGDVSGIEMAESLASRLPENQMRVRIEEGPLALSKAEVGRFDVLVLSDEAADLYDVSSLVSSDAVEVVHR